MTNRNGTKRMIGTLTLLLAATLLAPLALAGPKKAAKKAEKFPPVDLSSYSILYLEDFALNDQKAAKKEKHHEVAEPMTRWFPDTIEMEIKRGAFEKVRRGPSKGEVNAAVLRGSIQRYKPGDPMMRAVLAGMGRAKLKLEISVVDAQSGETLVTFPISRLWAWGGMVGASRGIEQMQYNVALQLARYLEQNRGEAVARR